MKNGRTSVAAFGVVAGIACAFALYTNHVWEDYYITYRAGKNLAVGNGLVFTPGERVQTYTSPFNTLIPGAFSALTGNRSDLIALWLYRLLSIALLGTAAALMVKQAKSEEVGPWALTLMVGVLATESKIVDFTINGQETAFMIVFLVWMVRILTQLPDAKPIPLGLSWAGLMWTRPDGFVYIGAVCAGFFLFSPRASRWSLVKLGIQAGLVAAVLYLPWTLFTWLYYGTPVPHPLVAKSLRFTNYTTPGSDVSGIMHYVAAASNAIGMITTTFSFPFRSLGLDTPLDDLYAPLNAWFGGWHYSVFVVSKYVSWVCAFYWVLPFGRPIGRALSFAFMGGALYLNYLGASPAPWYLPNGAILGILALGRVYQHALDGAAALAGQRQRLHTLWLTRLAGAGLLAFFAAILLCSAWQLRIQQRLIEEGVRVRIGLWLRDQAKSSRDTVFLEPLGYIGYFSQLKMYDWPGLSSLEMDAARKKTGGDDWARLIRELKPDWLVLRPKEAAGIAANDPALLGSVYREAQVFDAAPQVAAERFVPGRGYVTGDQTFTVYRRSENAR